MNLSKIYKPIIIALMLLISLNFTDKKTNKTDTSNMWKKVKNFEEKGLPKSALETVNGIYKITKKEQNNPEMVKCVLHIIKFTNAIGEKQFDEIIKFAENEINYFDATGKAVMNSMLGDMYWNYYEKNRWKIQNRTAIDNSNEKDITQWAYADFIKKVSELYDQSLSNTQTLKRTPIDDYEIIINAGNSRKERPYLYDLLINKTIDFYQNNEANLNFEGQNFVLNNDDVFASASEFVKLDFDYLNKNYTETKVILLVRDWLAFRLSNKKNKQALFYADLARLRYIKSVSSRFDSEELYFKNLKEMKQQYSENDIVAEIDFEIAKYYLSFSQLISEIEVKNSPYKDFNKEAHKILSNLKTQDLPKNIEAKVQIELNNLEKNSFYIKHDEVSFSSQEIPIHIEYKNTSTIYYKIHKIKHRELEDYERNYIDDEEYKKTIKNSLLVEESNIKIPEHSDFLTHTTEAKLKKRDKGCYIISYSDSPKFDTKNGNINYNFFQVSDIAYMHKQNEKGESLFFIADRESGHPIQGAEAQIILKQYDYRKQKNIITYDKKLYSDDNGKISIPNTDKYSKGFLLQITSKNDTLFTNRTNTYREGRYRPSKRTFLFTDRAIYRPGQTVFFKGLVIEKQSENNHKILTNNNSQVTFRDANGKKISTKDFQTNEYGTFSGSFVIPKGSLNGHFTLYTRTGNKLINVEEYKRPTFGVTIDKPKGQLKLDEEVEISGKVYRFNGTPSKNTSIKYRVVRTPEYSCWWRLNSSPTQINFGETTTDSEGNFTFNFTAYSGETKPSKKAKYNFQIEIDATNESGETQSETEQINITNTPLSADVNIADNFDKSEKKELFFYVKNNINQPEKADIDVKIFKLKNPTTPIIQKKWAAVDSSLQNIDKCIPNIQLVNSDYNEHLPTESRVFNQTFNVKGDSAITLNDEIKWEEGFYKLTYETKDSYNNTISGEKYFNIFDKNAKKPSYPQVFWSNFEGENLQPSEKIYIQMGSSEDIKVLYTVAYNNKTLHSEIIHLNNTVKNIEWEITETQRGGVSINLSFIYKGRFFNNYQFVRVPYTNKELNFTFETFRDKVSPGEDEEWTLKITGEKGEFVSTEVLALLYDKALDQYVEHTTELSLYNENGYSRSWNAYTFNLINSNVLCNKVVKNPTILPKTYDELNWFYAFNGGGYGIATYRNRGMLGGQVMMKSSNAPLNYEMETTELETSANDNALEYSADLDGTEDNYAVKEKPKNKTSKKINLRTNFNETAFFYPHLQTDKNGLTKIKFKVPDNLTTYKFQALAHTKNLEIGTATKDIIAQKDLMVEINAPRFVTQGDKIIIPAKIQNLTKNQLEGEARLELSNPLTGCNYNKIIKTKEIINFDCSAQNEQTVSWELEIPDTISALQYKVTASSGKHTDGEQKWIPVLSNRVLVTETQALWINGNNKKTFTLKGLKNSNTSSTLKHHLLTLEFTSNPSWYAVQALPYLMEQENKCTEQVFNAFYATQIAKSIVESNPTIKQVFEQWKAAPNNNAFLSNLQKNEELKQVLLKETPWVLDALNENEQKQNIALLFNTNQLNQQAEESINKLIQMQYPSGGWSWFEGMQESRYITQYITTGFGKLKHLGLTSNEKNPQVYNAITKALLYLDSEVTKDYQRWVKTSNKTDDIYLNNTIAQYLYMRSFFTDIAIKSENTKAVKFYKQQAQKNWLKLNKYGQAMIAIAFNRENDNNTANKILASIKEHALQKEEMGMYWKENVAGYSWHQAPVEFQSLMIEMFTEIKNDKNQENELKKWLLKNKQTNNWKTTRATADAIYAFMSSGTNWINSKTKIDIAVGNQNIDNKIIEEQSEPGTGYFKNQWQTTQISPEMSEVKLNREGDGISWGGLYWQYFEQIDKVKSAKSNIKVTKRIFKETITSKGKKLEPITEEQKISQGDAVIVRLDFETDRAMEYVHIRDHRAAAFEPQIALSGYQYLSGLSLYKSIHDTSVDFFIEYLPVGNYTLEYKLNVSHSGSFASGVANIQCMYAPEFNAHSKGFKITVEK